MDDARQLALSLVAAGDAAIARALLVDVRRVPAFEEEGHSSVSLATLAPLPLRKGLEKPRRGLFDDAAAGAAAPMCIDEPSEASPRALLLARAGATIAWRTSAFEI